MIHKTRIIATSLILLFVFLVCMYAKENEFQPTPFERESLQPKFPVEGRIVFQSNFDGDNEIYLI